MQRQRLTLLSMVLLPLSADSSMGMETSSGFSRLSAIVTGSYGYYSKSQSLPIAAFVSERANITVWTDPSLCLFASLLAVAAGPNEPDAGVTGDRMNRQNPLCRTQQQRPADISV